MYERRKDLLSRMMNLDNNNEQRTFLLMGFLFSLLDDEYEYFRPIIDKKLEKLRGEI